MPNNLNYITLPCVSVSDLTHFWYIIPKNNLMFTKNNQIMFINGNYALRINSCFLRKTHMGYLYRFDKTYFYFTPLKKIHRDLIISPVFEENLKWYKDQNLKFIYKKLDITNDIDFKILNAKNYVKHRNSKLENDLNQVLWNDTLKWLNNYYNQNNIKIEFADFLRQYGFDPKFFIDNLKL